MMLAFRISFKWVFQLLLIFILTFGVGGCGWVKMLSGKQPLPTVAALPLPKLPNWIKEISPTGEAETLAQIRINFQDALIPMSSLDGEDQQKILLKFEILPNIPGRFRFLTPSMVGFQADTALPKATRIKVTLKSGLRDLANHNLTQDLAWTFNTEPIKITDLPNTNPDQEKQPIDLQPKIYFTSNTELDLDSIRQNTKLIPEGQKAITLNANLIKEEEDKNAEYETPQDKFDPSHQIWRYVLTPQKTLEKATKYKLELAPGLRPVNGNLSNETAFFAQLETYSPLAFKGIEYFGQPDSGGTFGRFVNGSPQLTFNNGIVAESAVQHITISPNPKAADQAIKAYDNERLVNINPWVLEPNKRYTVTVDRDLKDKYGQSLGKTEKISFETRDLAGDIWTPSNFNIFPPGKNLQLDITTINLPQSQYKAAYKVVQPKDLVFAENPYPRGNNTDLLPKVDQWQFYSIKVKKNQALDVKIPIQEQLGKSTGLLAYGVQAKTNQYRENNETKWREATYYGMVQLTNLGVFSQWYPDSGLVRVNHLADGSPVVSDVEIYQSRLESANPINVSPCATGKTDESGILLLDKTALQGCFSNPDGFKDAPKLLVIARENEDWSFTRTDEYSGAYGYGFDGGWNATKPESRGAIFSDRQLYQPGEKVQLTGFAYFLQNGKLVADKEGSYQLTLTSPDGNTKTIGNQKANEFATFSIEVPLAANQQVGSYSVIAKGQNGREILGDFQVAEFRPPNFKVDLSLNQKFAYPNQKIEATTASSYLFGAPVEGGKTKYYVTRRQTNFEVKELPGFSFGRQWFYPEEPPVVPAEVMQAIGELDQAGKGKQVIKIGKDIPYPMQYQVDAQVTDVSNLAVSNSQSFIALPSDKLIGIRSEFVGEAGKPLAVELAVTNPDGQILTGDRVRVELQKMNYSSVTQVVEGSQTAKTQVEYKTVAQTEVSSGTSPQTVSLTPTESGSYRIRANFANTRDEITATDSQIWVTGKDAVVWGEQDKNRLQIKLDKANYKVGETATALIQSPYPEGELYFAVVRDKPMQRQLVKVSGGAPQVQFTVTPEMLPNAAIEAVLVRQGAPLSQTDTSNLDNLVKIGFASFDVNLEEQYLKVETQLAETLAPGSEQTIQLRLKDIQGNPTAGQLTVVVANESILQLSGYRLPDLVDTVYATQPISTRFSDNRANVVLQPASLRQAKGWGYGGGFSAGAANTRVRKDFQPIAFYQASLLTDDSGKAQVAFKVPDDLTTWRLMVVATDGNWHFGNADQTFMTTQNLIASPVLPQFARVGDRMEVGLSLTNTTNQNGNVSIQGSSQGVLQFQKSATLQTQASQGTQAYRFPLVATNPGDGKVQFTAQLNGTTDGFELPLNVKLLEVTEQVVQTGTTNNSVRIPLSIEKNTIPNAGGLTVSLASTLIPEITAPAKALNREEQLPFLEPAASQLLIAANLQRLPQTPGDINPRQLATEAWTTLQKLQKPDGGFATYPQAEQSDPWLTPYAAEAMARSQSAFPGLVSGSSIKQLQGYLQKVLANPGKYDSCNTVVCKNQLRLEALMALSALGDTRSDFLTDIVGQQKSFDRTTQLKLTQYLSQFPEWRSEADSLWQQLQETIYITGHNATVSDGQKPYSPLWIHSDTAAQSRALQLAVAQNRDSALVNKLLQSLLNLRRQGTWANRFDNAQALSALVDYSQTQPPSPDFSASAQLGRQNLLSSRFGDDRNSSSETTIPMQKLPKGRQDLTLKKSGPGTLHYLVNYQYRLAGNQPGRFQGLRVTREIKPFGQNAIGTIGLYAKDEPLKVPVGQVFEVQVEVITDHPVQQVIVTDPLPAGFEAVDNSFRTSAQALQAKADDFGFKQIYRDRIVAFADSLQPGVYTLRYLVRSVTPGSFFYPGAEAHLQYNPEELGRCADSTLVVSGS